jgi:multidrug/hemolysin transport system ATP-binding protein
MAIEVRSLSKSYRAVKAVDDVSFDVGDGEVFAFLGSNGAGKSTTIGCVTTALPFDTGEVRVAGFDVRREGEQIRRRIGVVFQNSLLDPELTATENLRFRARLIGLERSDETTRIGRLSELIGLGDFLTRPYGRLSGGQRRRVDIARALLGDPVILFLDEPTAGLDPASRAAVWSTVRQLRQERGLTVFLTTHYMEETEEADRVCIIDAGRIVAQDTPAALRAAHSRSLLTVTVTAADRDAVAAAATAEGLDGERDGDRVIITVADAAQALRILRSIGDRVVDFEFRHGRMDDVFLALTGHSHSDASVGA